MSQTMESISASTIFTWMTSPFKKEIQHFAVLIVTAYIGWWLFHRLGGGVFGFFSAQKKAKKVKKIEKYSEAANHELVTDQEGDCLSSSFSKSVAGQTVKAHIDPADFADFAEPSSSKQQPTVRPAKGAKASKQKNRAPEKDQPEGSERELGRVVCWRDTGFGFIVDEAAERLFVRQTEVEGEEKLMPGQLVWFRRGKTTANQATKAIEVVLVDVEVAKILRRAEKDGIPWSKLRTAINTGDDSTLAKFKALASSSAATCPSTSKGSNASATPPACENVQAPPCKVAPRPAANDADLRAFLGNGSVDEMRQNLKYAPQWVQEKFIACHGA